MSRYRVTLVPQGIIPKNIHIGIQMTPLVEPAVAEAEAAVITPPACVVNCVSLSAIGWASVGGVASPVTGSAPDEMAMTGGPWTVQVFVTGELCGGTLEFNLGGTLVEDVDYVAAPAANSIWLFGPKGCEPPYSGNITVQATLNGDDFCEELNITFAGDGGGCGGGESGCWDPAIIDGSTTFTDADTDIPFVDMGSNSGLPLFWDVLSVGTSVPVTPSITTSDNITYHFVFTNPGMDDLTGAQFICVPYLDAGLTNPYCTAVDSAPFFSRA